MERDKLFPALFVEILIRQIIAALHVLCKWQTEAFSTNILTYHQTKEEQCKLFKLFQN